MRRPPAAWFANVGALGEAALGVVPGLGELFAPYVGLMGELGGSGFFENMVAAVSHSCGRLEGVEGIEGSYGCE